MWKINRSRKSIEYQKVCNDCEQTGQKCSLVLSAAEAEYGSIEDALIRLFDLEEEVKSIEEKYIDEHQKRIQLLDVVSRMEGSKNA
jgi:hypothetical protein